MKTKIEILSLMKELAARPEMYGLYSLSDFISYFRGWSAGNSGEREESFFADFQTLLPKKFKSPPANGWIKLAVANLGNDVTSIPDFVKLAEEIISMT